VRQFFILCTILIQLLGYISAEAKATMPPVAGAQKENPLTIPSAFQHDHPLDVSPSNHFSSSAFKVRNQRNFPVLAGCCDSTPSILRHSGKNPDAYASPLFLPLIRSLLFPNHYFW
jgi:hypothetical protein